MPSGWDGVGRWHFNKTVLNPKSHTYSRPSMSLNRATQFQKKSDVSPVHGGCQVNLPKCQYIWYSTLKMFTFDISAFWLLSVWYILAELRDVGESDSDLNAILSDLIVSPFLPINFLKNIKVKNCHKISLDSLYDLLLAQWCYNIESVVLRNFCKNRKWWRHFMVNSR